MIQSIQRNMAWRAVPIAGFAAGTVFLLTNLILTPVLLDVGASLVLRYIGSLVMGDSVLIETSMVAPVVGVIVHYVLSMLFALIIAVVVHRWGLAVGIIGGGILGLCLYMINLYTMTVFFPWFFAINNSVLILSHVLFGVVAGGVYETLDTFDLPLVKEDAA